MKKLVQSLALALLTVFCASMLLACAPANLEKAQELLEKADYIVTVTMAEEGNEDNRVGTIVAFKAGLGASGISAGGLTATLFKSSKDAKAYYNSHVDEDAAEDSILKLSGKWVYFGSADACEVLFG